MRRSTPLGGYFSVKLLFTFRRVKLFRKQLRQKYEFSSLHDIVKVHTLNYHIWVIHTLYNKTLNFLSTTTHRIVIIHSHSMKVVTRKGFYELKYV